MLRSKFNHPSFMSILKQSKQDTIVEADTNSIVEYFKQYFDGKFCMNALDFDDDLLQDYNQLDLTSVNSLNAPITLTELLNTVNKMNTSASPGTFGLDLHTLKTVLTNPRLADLILHALQRWVWDGDPSNELFLAILSAIPKQDKPTNEAKNLRPISVTSIWYRVIAKIFQDRLSQFLPNLYSANQHGFCPGKNVQTALLNILTSIEGAKLQK